MATTISLDHGFRGKPLAGKGYEYSGTGAWTVAETTGTVAVPFGTILSAEISSNDTALPVAHAISLTLSTGTLAISRAAGGTNDASFSFRIRGY